MLATEPLRTAEPLHPDDAEALAPRPEHPRVSVVVPAYLSHETVGGCLEALRRQEYRNFEVVLVDSSPDERTAQVVRGGFPEIRFVRSMRRLLPHAARNEGVSRARGDLLAFTDPDVYPRPDWLGELVAAHEATGHPVVGALACHGRRWLDVGIHLCKFSKWLPAGGGRPVDMSPTANMLLDRASFEAVGGFDGECLLGDALLSWRLVERGHTLWFAPRAEVAHHHLSGPRSFLRERFERGVLFGDLRAAWSGHGRGRSLLYLAVSLLPIRVGRILALVAGHCRAAGELRGFFGTLPVVALGHAASLLGESRAHLRHLLGRQGGAGGWRLRTQDHPAPVRARLDEAPLGR